MHTEVHYTHATLLSNRIRISWFVAKFLKSLHSATDQVEVKHDTIQSLNSCALTKCTSRSIHHNCIRVTRLGGVV